jgi:hypothetical protein
MGFVFTKINRFFIEQFSDENTMQKGNSVQGKPNEI